MLTESQESPSPESSNQTDSGSGGPTSLFRDKILLGTVIGAFVLDQVSKRAITSLMDLGESWPSEGFFRITYGTNSGTAFGLFPNQTTLLIVVSMVAIGFLFYFYRVRQSHRPGTQRRGRRLYRRWPMADLQPRGLLDCRWDLHPHGDLPADQGVEGGASCRPDACGERDAAPTGLYTGLDEG